MRLTSGLADEAEHGQTLAKYLTVDLQDRDLAERQH